MNQENTSYKLSLLREVARRMDEERLREIAALMRIATYPAGHVLCHEGKLETLLYLIAEGSAVVTRESADGQGTLTLGHADRGDLVGESGIIQSGPRSATVTTETDCIVLEMEKADLESILGHNPAVAVGLVNIANERQRINDVIAMQELFAAGVDWVPDRE